MKIAQKPKRSVRWRIVLGVLLGLAVFLGILLYRSKYCLTNASYTIHTSRLEETIRLVQLTDLHNSTFGQDNQRLIQMVAEQSPNLILITGDLINSGVRNTEIATQLITDLCGIAPVYVSLGNHEVEYQEEYNVNLTAAYEKAGATVLEKSYEDITVNGQSLRIGGIYGYCLPEEYLISGEANPEECAFLSEFQDTKAYKLLLCHMPVCWIGGSSLGAWNVDCVLTGHLHGGQIILPGIGGLYAPDMGWFPGRLRGLYTSEDGRTTVVLSAGLGNTERIPRFHNIPEIVTVDLQPEQE